MSWSLESVGRASAVAAEIAREIARYKCAEPEETIKNNLGSVIATALAAFPESGPVRVKANGSQSPGPDGKFTNNLSLSIEPIWGFRE